MFNKKNNLKKVICDLKNNVTQMFNFSCLKDFSNWGYAVDASLNTVCDGMIYGDLSYVKIAGESLDIVSAEYDKLWSSYLKDEYRPILQDYFNAIDYYKKAYEALQNYCDLQLDGDTRIDYFNRYQGLVSEANNYNQAACMKANDGFTSFYIKAQE